mmetsp:Transcript_30924/g.99779  ORF Transcript_30924/g.99779 Transcript_30924/m.99779 type:complete len:220 (-) Transcript_30924:47-706(-)
MLRLAERTVAGAELLSADGSPRRREVRGPRPGGVLGAAARLGGAPGARRVELRQSRRDDPSERSLRRNVRGSFRGQVGPRGLPKGPRGVAPRADSTRQEERQAPLGQRGQSERTIGRRSGGKKIQQVVHRSPRRPRRPRRQRRRPVLGRRRRSRRLLRRQGQPLVAHETTQTRTNIEREFPTLRTPNLRRTRTTPLPGPSRRRRPHEAPRPHEGRPHEG